MILERLRANPLVASAQASEGSPLAGPKTISQLAEASVGEGVRFLRLEGVESIGACAHLDADLIGLIKQRYEGSEVYITPTEQEVRSLLETRCEIIALDATRRPRPGGTTFEKLVRQVHDGGRLVMADCDTLESAKAAQQCGADLIGTTLCGYTRETRNEGPRPSLELLRSLIKELTLPVIAEGRYSEPWQVEAALRIGATAVVVGGALNDPVKQTRRFLPSKPTAVLAFDLGGTWIRSGVFDSDWQLLEQNREPMPRSRASRLEWMAREAERTGLRHIGIGTGGTVDPRTAVVVEAKPLIPEHEGTDFRAALPGCTVFALNDGLATAWAHACHPEFAGRRVATLALGTGVGCGLVDEGRILVGPAGEYPRLNDLGLNGQTIEAVLGGCALGTEPSEKSVSAATAAATTALDAVRKLWLPEVVVVCGGVGLAPWLDLDARRSPFGEDAGLFGAAATALYPPRF